MSIRSLTLAVLLSISSSLFWEAHTLAGPSSGSGCVTSLAVESVHNQGLRIAHSQVFLNDPKVGEELIVKASSKYKILSSAWFIRLIGEQARGQSGANTLIKKFQEFTEIEKLTTAREKFNEITRFFFLGSEIVTSFQRLTAMEQLQLSEELFNSQREFFKAVDQHPELKEYLVSFFIDITPAMIRTQGTLHDMNEATKSIGQETSDKLGRFRDLGLDIEQGLNHPVPAIFIGGISWGFALLNGLQLIGVESHVVPLPISFIAGFFAGALTEGFLAVEPTPEKDSQLKKSLARPPATAIVSMITGKVVQLLSTPFALPTVIKGGIK